MQIHDSQLTSINAEINVEQASKAYSEGIKLRFSYKKNNLEKFILKSL